MKLNKATINNLTNKKPTLGYLLEKDLATVGSCYELFETIENHGKDFYSEAYEYLGGKGYKIVF